MNEIVRIEQNLTVVAKKNRKKYVDTSDGKPSNAATYGDKLISERLSDDDMYEHTYFISYDKGVTNDAVLYGRSEKTEVIRRTNEDSTVPPLVNSSFDTSIDGTSMEDTRHISSISSDHHHEVDVSDSNDLTTIKDADRALQCTDNIAAGMDVTDELQGSATSNENSTINDINAMHEEANNKVLITRESCESASFVDSPLLQQNTIDEEQSESLTESFFSCRDEASVSDNINSDGSFHTAINKAGSITNSTPASVYDVDDYRSEQFRDCLSCRSDEEEPSSHIYDFSSSRVDDQLSELDSSLLSYHTCRKFNQQGLISILKKGGVDNDCSPGKQFNIPIDISIKEANELSLFAKSTKSDCRENLRNKYFRGAGFIALIILVIPTITVLMINQNTFHVTSNEKATNESGSIPNNNTNLATTYPPTAYPSQTPSCSPSITFITNMVPSKAPSIQPTSSRHHDNIFLRPTKKRTTSKKVKLNSTLV